MAGDGKPRYFDIDAGTPETGQWCPTCNLPSVRRIPLNHIGADGVRCIGEVTRCDHCTPEADER